MPTSQAWPKAPIPLKHAEPNYRGHSERWRVGVLHFIPNESKSQVGVPLLEVSSFSSYSRARSSSPLGVILGYSKSYMGYTDLFHGANLEVFLLLRKDFRCCYLWQTHTHTHQKEKRKSKVYRELHREKNNLEWCMVSEPTDWANDP